LASVAEQRRSRRWGILFKSLFLFYLFALLWLVMADHFEYPQVSAQRHTALVDLRGIIVAGGRADAETVLGGIREAFDDDNTAGVILRVNSPGGSPVQAAAMFDEIRRLRSAHPDTPIYAVIEDVGASGGYFVAAAADEIYANRSSIVGSIGVRSDGFGFTDAIEKLGIKRRLYTAGENKALMDPFEPVEAQDVEHLQQLLDSIHQHFIAAVEEGRGDRLRGDVDGLYSGLMWTGDESVELGLVDGLGDVGFVARELIGEDKLVNFTRRKDLLGRIAERLGTAVTDALSSSLGLAARL
jgi:protease-4